MNLRDQLTSVENQLAEEKSNLDKNPGLIAQLEERQAQLLSQISEQEAVQQERIQVQEEKVQSIKLPYDFNELYGDSTANDSIIEVTQIFLREANTEHNAEVQKLTEDHREEIRASADRELQLKRQNEELQQRNEFVQNEILRLSQENQQLKLERDDALAKRDAAVSEKEGVEVLLAEKQAHIDKLRDEIAIGASRAINVINVDPSAKLAALVEQSKSAKIKSSLELALERNEPIRGKIDVVAPPKALEEATFPAQASNTANNGLDNTSTSQLSTVDSEVGFPEVPIAQAPEVPTLRTELATGQPETSTQGQVTREEFEALKNRVAELEKASGVSEEAA